MNTSEIVNVLRQVSDKLEKSENVESSVNEVLLGGILESLKNELDKRDFILRVNDYINEGDLDIELDYNNRIVVYLPDHLDICDFIVESVGDFLDDVFDNLKKDLSNSQGIFSQEEK